MVLKITITVNLNICERERCHSQSNEERASVKSHVMAECLSAYLCPVEQLCLHQQRLGNSCHQNQ